MVKQLVALILCLLSSASAYCDEPLKIGAIFSLSGFGALAGKEELNGLEMAKEAINNSGGIRGRQVQLILEDNRSDLKSTAAAFQKLSNFDHVPVVIGPNWAEFTEVVAPMADALKLPTVTPSGWKKGLLIKHPYLYSLLPPHALGARPLAKALSDNGYKRVALIVSQNAFFLSFTDALTEQLKNVSVVDRIEILPNNTDFRSLLRKLSKNTPDAVVALLEEGGGLQAMLRQYKDLKIPHKLFVGGLMYQADQKLFATLADGIPTVEYLAVGTPEFKKKYQEKYGVPASGSAARAYDALFVVKQAIDGCGMTREQIQKCLPKTNYLGFSGHIAFGPTRENLDQTPISAMMMLMGGKYHLLNERLEPQGVYLE